MAKRKAKPGQIDLSFSMPEFYLAAYASILDPYWRPRARTDIVKGFHLAELGPGSPYFGCHSKVLPLLDKLVANPTEAEATTFAAAIDKLRPVFKAFENNDNISVGPDGLAAYMAEDHSI